MGRLTVITTVLVPATAMFTGGAQFDLVSLDDLKEELQIIGTTSDSWLAKQITKASDSITHFCSRVFQPQTYQDQVWAFRDAYPWQLPGSLFPLQLAKWPICSTPSLAGTAPPIAPLLGSIAGGALAAQRYYARISLVTVEGESAASLESNLMVAGGNLLTVAAPMPDKLFRATGWNCYIGTTAQGETLQTSAPLPMTVGFTLPTTGLVAGTPLPNHVLVVEQSNTPVPLAESVDFDVDYRLGQLTRIDLDGYARKWPGLPLTVQYQAGFTTIPPPLQDCAIQLVKARWFARQRDPNVKSENIEGVYSASYQFGTGPGGTGDMPVYVSDKLDRDWRVPVIE
jgi:hypothetical protein